MISKSCRNDKIANEPIKVKSTPEQDEEEKAKETANLKQNPIAKALIYKLFEAAKE